MAFETCVHTSLAEEEAGFIPVDTFPGIRVGPGESTTKAYLTWAPSHPEFCLLTEVLTYANLLNGMKARDKEKLRAKLQGKSDKQQIEGHEHTSIQVDSKLYNLMPKGSMVTFARQNGISFKICLEYIEYLRGLLKPYLQS